MRIAAHTLVHIPNGGAEVWVTSENVSTPNSSVEQLNLAEAMLKRPGKKLSSVFDWKKYRLLNRGGSSKESG